MTTIAANVELGIMAADSRAVLYDKEGIEPSHAYQCYKLVRLHGWIIGCAGNQEDIDAFMAWLPDKRKKRKRVKEDFGALLLSRKRLLFITDDCTPEQVRTAYMACGSGSGYALAAMSAMTKMGMAADPRVAVEIACELDTNSAPPIDFLNWKR